MDSETLNKIINNITVALKEQYHPQKLVLFGSCAWGKATEDSDVDMLIIKNTKKNSTQRWIEVRRLTRDLKRHIPFSPLVYTPQEIRQRLELGDFFIKDILNRGKVLYEKK